MTDPRPTPSSGDSGSRPLGVARRLADQWAALRRSDSRAEAEAGGPGADARRTTTSAAITHGTQGAPGTSGFSRNEVPYGVDLAAAWAWRLLVIAGGLFVLSLAISKLAVLVIPLIIALLLTALVEPVVGWLGRYGVKRGVGALLVVLLTFGAVGALLGFAGQQVASGADDLRNSSVGGLNEIRGWLHDGPLQLSDQQLRDYFHQAENGIKNVGGDQIFSRAGEVGSAFADTLAGFFIVIFSTYFFLADGAQIWAFLVRLMPRAGRERTDSSGRVAWLSLKKFVHATVIVAATDAIMISVGAAILGVPFVLAIGVLVFLGAFIPILGATVAGAVAVLVALVDQGFVQALIMLGIVIAVNQIESHLLQPFLMGRWVRVHPLGVIFAIGAGVIIAGIPGALVAVPFTAAANAVVQHLAGFTSVGQRDHVENLDRDYAERGEQQPADDPDYGSTADDGDPAAAGEPVPQPGG